MAAPNPPQVRTPPKASQVLRIYRYDPSTATAKQKQIIQLNANQAIKDSSLKDIRELLINNSVFDSKDFKSPFCEKNGSDVGDDMQLELYLNLLGITTTENPKLDVYFKTKKLFNKVDEATQAFISQKLDLAFENPPEVIKKKPELLTSAFDLNFWQAAQGKLSHAADLSEKQWSVIIRANCLLGGHQVTLDTDNKTPRRIERSAYNAFNLRPRRFDAYEISEKNADPKNYVCRIPHYRVDDESSVTVTETKSAFEKSLAESSFSEYSFQVAGAAAYGPVSAGLKYGHSGGSSSNKGRDERKKEEKLVVNYNFPRVSIHWDPICLDISEECLEDIDRVKDERSLGVFHSKYGLLFARKVQLGGRLSCSKAKTATAEATSEDEASKFKAEASASISASFAQASVDYSHENQEKQTKESSSQKLENTIAWEATGGDTLLCNNPPKWCASVGQYTTWRVVNQDDAVPLYHFLSYFPQAGPEIITRFELSAKGKLTKQKDEELKAIVKQRLEDADKPKESKRYPVFQLYSPSEQAYMRVVNSSDIIYEHFYNLNFKNSNEEERKVLDAVKSTVGSVTCDLKVPDNTTEFMADILCKDGENQHLKFGEKFHVQSRSHVHHQWLALDPTTYEHWAKSHGWQMRVHLSEAPGAYVRFIDPYHSANRDYIKDGDLVYVEIDMSDKLNRPDCDWTQFYEIDYRGLICVEGFVAANGPDRKFKYVKKGLVEL